MKRRSSGFHFRGFVALADLIFAVSAGLLLLNPVHFENMPTEEESARAAPAVLHEKIMDFEQSVPEMEAAVRELQTLAGKVLKSEQP